MIFAGGYNLKKSNFVKNFLYISLYGVSGTLVTFGLILGLTLAINQKGFIK
jgi:sodium/hydrogen exchanger-like protein 6/7/sodium/hydrogen exchanger 8